MRDFAEFTTRRRGPGRFGRRRRLGQAAIVVAVMLLGVGLAFASFGSSVTSGALSSLGTRYLPDLRGVPDRAGESGEEGGAGSAADAYGGSGEEAYGGSGETEPVNVLLIGLDRPEGESGSQRADTLMIARTYPDTGEVKLLSVPRDLLVPGPDGGRGRINASYARGGASAAVREVEELIEVEIDHYVAADFEGFREIIDSLGGVEVRVKGDYLSRKGIPAGRQVLSGEEALTYARYRKTPRGDLGRIERQQRLLSALRSKALSLDSLVSGPAIFGSLREHVETDLGPGRAISLGRALLKSDGQNGGVESDQLEGEPVTLYDGRQVLLPKEERNDRILYEFLG